MTKKNDTAKNKMFKTVRDKLEFIHNHCKEPELFEDLKQLFRKKGFTKVSIEHGNKEFGKDLVFCQRDNLFNEDKWYAVIVKNKNASQNDFVTGGEIFQQIELAIKTAYKDTKGINHNISGVFIIINGSVSFNVELILKDFFSPILISNIKIWNYQELSEEIEKNIKDIFLNSVEPVINVFNKVQISKLSDLKTTNQLFNLDIEDIDDIFVNVQTTYSKHVKKLNEYMSFDKENKGKIDDDVDGIKEILDSNKNFIIHGIATSGKSLLVRRLGIKALSPKNGKPNCVFFFDLPKIVNSLKKNEKIDFEHLMKEQYKEYTDGENFNKDDFEKIFLLLDSLDEVKSNDLKVQTIDLIEKMSKKDFKPLLQIILTTRTTEIIDKEDLLKDFEKSELLPFNVGQALALIKKIIPDNKTKSNAFISAMKDSLLKSGLLRTPLALTLMAILYRDELIDLKELPANITELYNKFVDTYLNRWDTTKGISHQYKYEQTKNILAYIAFRMHVDGTNDIDEQKLTAYLNELKDEYSYEELGNLPDFIEHLKLTNGIFNFDDINMSFAFYNHYFQEYFVSLCIDDTTESKLNENFFSEWWENSIVFYCGKQPKRDVFLNSSCKKVVPVALKDKYTFIQLLSKCLQASHSIPKKSRVKVVERLLLEFNNFYVLFIEEGKQGKTLAASNSTMNIIIQFRDFFEKIFWSKHITTPEVLEYFNNVLLEDNSEYTDVTRYCLSYFISLHTGNPAALELFLERNNISIIWTRILYVDINFFRFKKKIDEKTFARIRKKMKTHKYTIIEQLKGRSTDFLGGKEILGSKE